MNRSTSLLKERVARDTGALRWPRWAAYAALLWSLAYGVLGLYWTLGGTGFPYGRESDPSAALSIFAYTRSETGAPVVAAVGFVGAGIALAISRGRGILRVAGLVFAWSAATALTLVIPDYRVLMATAYAPMVLLGAPFGWPPGVSLADAFPWPVVNQFVGIFSGLAWAATALAYGRRSWGACVACGRAAAGSGWTTARSAARWGRWAVAVAVVIPILYAVTRWAWALGVPLGISEAFLRRGQAMGLWWAGAALARL